MNRGERESGTRTGILYVVVGLALLAIGAWVALLNGREDIPATKAETPFPASPHEATTEDVLASESEQPEGEPVETVESAGGTISGRVTDTGGKPVPAVEVHAWGSDAPAAPIDTRHTLTAPDGRYRLLNLKQAKYVLRVRHRRYVPIRSDEVAPGTSGVDFIFSRKPRIEGRVIDATTGSPVTHFKYFSQAAFETVEIEDEEGRFTIENVDVVSTRWGQKFVFTIEASGYSLQDYAISDLSPGRSYDAVISLTPVPIVDGVVVDSSGAPVRAAKIYTLGNGFLGDWFGKGRTLAYSRDDGTFTLESLDRRIYTLFASRDEQGLVYTTIDLVSTRNRLPVPIVLVQWGAILGKVYIEDEPLAGVAVRAYNGLQDRVSAVTGELGDYAIEHLLSGDVNLTVTYPAPPEPVGPYPLTVRRSLTAHATVTSGQITIVDFDFPAGNGALEGIVTYKGRPMTGGSIHFVAKQDSGHRESRYGDVESTGRYRLNDLPTGPASISATAYLDSGRDHIYSTRAFEVNIAESETTRFDVELGGGGTISGRVKGIRPGSSAQIRIYRGDIDPRDLAEAFAGAGRKRADAQPYVDENGDFRTQQEIEPGTYTVFAALWRNGNRLVDPFNVPHDLRVIEVPEDGEVTVDFNLR